MIYYGGNDYRDYLAHYGVLGMRWGIRRYQPYSVKPRGSGKTGKEIGEARSYGKASGAVEKGLLNGNSDYYPEERGEQRLSPREQKALQEQVNATLNNLRNKGYTDEEIRTHLWEASSNGIGDIDKQLNSLPDKHQSSSSQNPQYGGLFNKNVSPEKEASLKTAGAIAASTFQTMSYKNYNKLTDSVASYISDSDAKKYSDAMSVLNSSKDSTEIANARKALQECVNKYTPDIKDTLDVYTTSNLIKPQRSKIPASDITKEAYKKAIESRAAYKEKYGGLFDKFKRGDSSKDSGSSNANSLLNANKSLLNSVMDRDLSDTKNTANKAASDWDALVRMSRDASKYGSSMNEWLIESTEKTYDYAKKNGLSHDQAIKHLMTSHELPVPRKLAKQMLSDYYKKDSLSDKQHISKQKSRIKAMKSRGYTYAEIAKRLGIPVGSLSYYLNS